MQFKDRVLILIETHANGKLKEFADLTQLPYSTIHDVIKERNKMPSIAFAIAILQAIPELNANWLLLGAEPQYHYLDTLKTMRANIDYHYNLLANMKSLIESGKPKMPRVKK